MTRSFHMSVANIVGAPKPTRLTGHVTCIWVGLPANFYELCFGAYFTLYRTQPALTVILTLTLKA